MYAYCTVCNTMYNRCLRRCECDITCVYLIPIPSLMENLQNRLYFHVLQEGFLLGDVVSHVTDTISDSQIRGEKTETLISEYINRLKCGFSGKGIVLCTLLNARLFKVPYAYWKTCVLVLNLSLQIFFLTPVKYYGNVLLWQL